jgi:cytoskeletal protein CcmA (bactofilin family)
MWKKDEPSNPISSPQAKGDPMPHQDRTQDRAGGTAPATIGRSITIHGEVTGDEDLLIQGRVEGSVELRQQSITVGQDGRVTAAITGRIIIVEGQVEGDLKAEEQVVLKASAKVQGDIASPRVVLEDGANFSGGVDMGTPLGKKASVAASSPAQTKKPTEVTGSDSDPKKDGQTKQEVGS